MHISRFFWFVISNIVIYSIYGMGLETSFLAKDAANVHITPLDRIASLRNAISFFTDPLYSAFHDEEWGVPVVHDDRKLFELLVFSQALAEHTWPSILNHRDMFRHVHL